MAESSYILETEVAGFTTDIDVGMKGMKIIKDDSEIWGFSNNEWRVVLFIKMEIIGEEDINEEKS